VLKIKIKRLVISELRGVTCHMGSHNTSKLACLTTAKQVNTRFTYPEGMKG